MSTRLVVGLGNPGPRYEGTRHNVGAEIVRAFARRHRVALDDQRFGGLFGGGRLGEHALALLLPQTYMNDSGRAVAAALAALPEVDPASDLLVVYDDLDLPFGRIRLRPRGSAGGQRGMASVIAALGGDGFARLRFGVGRPGEGDGAVDHVLAGFDSEERAQLAERIERAADALEHALVHGVASAMDRFNRAEPAAPAPEG